MEGYYEQGILHNGGRNCEIVKCDRLEPYLNQIMQPTDGAFEYGNVFNFTCASGYQPADPNVPVTQQLQCVHDPGYSRGRWEGNRVACSKIECGQLHAPAQGSINCNDSNWYQSECKFDCSQGYILNGSPSRNCQYDKQWTGTDAFCEAITCERLNPLPNVVVSPSNCTMSKTNYLESCIFTCKPGYTSTDGKETLITTCGASTVPGSNNGTWTESTDGFNCQDTTPPTIVCPGDITADNDPGLDSAEVTWAAPVAMDTTGVTPVVMSSDSPPHRFSVGKHTVNYTAVDEADLMTSCYFEIEIKDVEPPTLLSCPDDIITFAEHRVIQVFWKEPTFVDNADEELRIFKTQANGTEFYWGTYIVEYRAEDDAGNSRTCEFKIDVAPHRCEYYRPPVNGATACDTWLYGQFCTILCNHLYEFATSPAELYVCGGSGDWTTFPLGFSLPWPDCSERRDPNEVNKGLESQYFVGNCLDNTTQLQIKEQFLEILQGTVWGMVGACMDAHGNDACLVENVVVYCGEVNDTITRHKRDLLSRGFNQVARISYNVAVQVLNKTDDDDLGLQNYNHIKNTIEEIALSVERETHLGSLQINLDNTIITPDTEFFHAEETKPVCANGTFLRTVGTRDLCINCALGSFYNVSSGQCDLCQPGSYQDEEAQLECKYCDVGYWTVGNHATNYTECKEICKPGTYSTTGLAACKECPKGSYQSYPRQQTCQPCPQHTTTFSPGATSQDSCQMVCAAGSFSASGVEPCKPCPKGTYQPDKRKKNCIKCPGTQSTVTIGATSAVQCVDIDDCQSNPCLNWATCVDGKDSYTCTCRPGFTGVLCETDIDDCSTNPCGFNATCLDRVNAVDCVCPHGYFGDKCQYEKDECSSSPCLNNATCFDEDDGFRCFCADGYSGRFCETEIDECLTAPCLNGGTCVDHISRYNCRCKPGFLGFKCELNLNECASTPCQNGGSCVDGDGIFVCNCPDGFVGSLCESNVDECVQNFCQNGAVCADGVNGYDCICPPSYSGVFCETKMSSDFDMSFIWGTLADYSIVNMDKDLQAFTIAFWMETSDDINAGTVFSYATQNEMGNVTDNALTVTDYNSFKLHVNNEEVFTAISPNDGEWHHIAVTWSNEDGSWRAYQDGRRIGNGTNLQTGFVIPGGGKLVIGQEQDDIGGRFGPDEVFIGDLSRLNLWDYELSEEDIYSMASNCHNSTGNVKAWPDFIAGLEGRVKLSNSSSFCDGLEDCSVDFCNNGGTCIDKVNGSSCDCPSGYTGDLCDTMIHGCHPNPCLNGKCVYHSEQNTTACACSPGFTGTACETAIDFCNPDPCLNGGVCHNGDSDYQCSCRHGFIGHLCEIAVTCSAPLIHQHASIQPLNSEYAVGSHVTYSCAAGYELLGPHTHTCTHNGVWSGQETVCADIDECKTNHHNCAQHCWNTDGSFYCACDPGYTLSTDNATCTDIDECSLPELFGINGGCDHHCHNTPGSYFCTCDDGYEKTVTGGRCIDKDECVTNNTCSQLCLNHAGGYSCECEAGYEPLGDGEFCKAIQCPEPVHPQNADVSTTQVVQGAFHYGDTASITCSPGHKLVGSPVITCDETGQWSNSYTYCKEVLCSSIGNIENGTVTIDKLNVGGTAQLSCNAGYILFGQPTLSCLQEGVWNHPTPYCIEYDCVPPAPPANGDIIGRQYTTGSRVRVQCNDGFATTESAVLICQDDHTWSAPVPDCLPVNTSASQPTLH
ncbi:sushi, von Willebrand factor type A, EGF and pentraxin domain-containing protein 1-like [Branchiostoma floridae x Branchiostoma japonicum]